MQTEVFYLQSIIIQIVCKKSTNYIDKTRGHNYLTAIC